MPKVGLWILKFRLRAVSVGLWSKEWDYEPKKRDYGRQEQDYGIRSGIISHVYAVPSRVRTLPRDS